MIKLREDNFGCVVGASGVQNSLGQGWPYHKIYKKFIPGFDFTGMTFCAKTATVDPRMPTKEEKGKGKGNLCIDWHSHMPIEIFPDCIAVDFINARTWNAVGLSCPGARMLFARNVWQNMSEPHFLSYMPVGKTKSDRLEESRRFADTLKCARPHFKAPVALQSNRSCPNTGHKLHTFLDENNEHRAILQDTKVPVVEKYDVATPLSALKEAANSGLIDGLVIPNTLSFGLFPEFIDWESHKKNPLVRRLLKKYGTCGYAGLENTLLAAARIMQLREAGINITLIGGGVRNPAQVLLMKEVGADGIEFGSAAIVRPWNVQPIIQTAWEVFGEDEAPKFDLLGRINSLRREIWNE